MGIVELKTNDLPIRLRDAKIHKYVIKFAPKDLPTKHKLFLANPFVARLNLLGVKTGKKLIYDHKFEILSPTSRPELQKSFCHVACFRHREPFEGAMVSYCGAEKRYSKYWTGDIRMRTSGQDWLVDQSASMIESLQLCTVYVQEDGIECGLDKSNPSPLQNGDGGHEYHESVIKALDTILLEEAQNTSCVQVYGSRLFAMAGEPALNGVLVELRKGVIAETCAINITPCTGFFLKATNLADLVRLLCSRNTGTGPCLQMDQIGDFLKRLKIIKSYGKRDIVRTVGLAVGNADQETFYWNGHTTTVTRYLNKVYKLDPQEFNQCLHQKCIVAGSLERTESIPTALCHVLPGRRFPLQIGAKYFRSIIETTSNDAAGMATKRAYHGLLDDQTTGVVSWTDGLLAKLIRCSTSPTIAREFGVEVAGTREHFVFSKGPSEHCGTVVEGEDLVRRIRIGKKIDLPDRPIIVLALTSSEFKILSNIIAPGFKACRCVSSRVTVHNITKYEGGGIDQILSSELDAPTKVATKSVPGRAS